MPELQGDRLIKYASLKDFEEVATYLGYEFPDRGKVGYPKVTGGRVKVFCDDTSWKATAVYPSFVLEDPNYKDPDWENEWWNGTKTEPIASYRKIIIDPWDYIDISVNPSGWCDDTAEINEEYTREDYQRWQQEHSEENCWQSFAQLNDAFLERDRVRVLLTSNLLAYCSFLGLKVSFSPNKQVATVVDWDGDLRITAKLPAVSKFNFGDEVDYGYAIIPQVGVERILELPNLWRDPKDGCWRDERMNLVISKYSI